MKLNLILFLVIFLVACNTNTNKDKPSADNTTAGLMNNTHSKQADFAKFISKFKVLNMPVVITPLEQHGKEKLSLIYGSDTSFINTVYKDTAMDKVYAYGLLPDTANNYKVLWLTPAEIYLPVLTTFSKTGQKISEEHLTVGKCGDDCCYFCKEIIKINLDLSIYCADSIKQCECDDKGPKESTMKHSVIFKTGNIAADGTINLSKETEKKL